MDKFCQSLTVMCPPLDRVGYYRFTFFFLFFVFCFFSGKIGLDISCERSILFFSLLS